ncbi:cytochrome P450 [Auricularia subglabra TFB-10046 SS5]|nr:cytochrome P450 [Auricularia subglabra TFB-10046 SS5]
MSQLASAATLAVLLVVTVCAVARGTAFILRTSRRLPPGPRRIPWLGNVLDLPTERHWVQFSSWANEHGDVVCLTALGQPIIVLSSSEAVDDLLNKRSAIYSDRPPFYMAGELVGWKNTLVGMRYGERFRHGRKYTNRIMGARGSQTYIPEEEHATRVFLRRLATSPERFEAHVRWAAVALIMKLLYGYNAAEEDDRLVAIAAKALTNFSLATAPGWIVDQVPALRFLPSWLPGMGFLRLARVWRAELSALMDEPFKFVKKQQSSGIASRSVTLSLLQGEDGDGVPPQEEEFIKYIAASLYSGASDTTVSSNLSFFLAMTLYPDVQRKAQEEIDALTGGERLPVYADREHLPYVNALVKEIHRWHPVLPIGLPHCLSEADEYRGWHIPAGSILIPNVWHILRDPANYPDPTTFDPERFLRASAPGTNGDPKAHAFGYGRRECPGRYIADSSVWLMVAMTLAAFDVSKASDSDGKPIIPGEDYEPGTLSHPTPFKCDIKLRSEKWETLIPAERVLTRSDVAL